MPAAGPRRRPRHPARQGDGDHAGPSGAPQRRQLLQKPGRCGVGVAAYRGRRRRAGAGRAALSCRSRCSEAARRVAAGASGLREGLSSRSGRRIHGVTRSRSPIRVAPPRRTSPLCAMQSSRVCASFSASRWSRSLSGSPDSAWRASEAIYSSPASNCARSAASTSAAAPCATILPFSMRNTSAPGRDPILHPSATSCVT